jgi:hypothetical protein
VCLVTASDDRAEVELLRQVERALYFALRASPHDDGHLARQHRL